MTTTENRATQAHAFTQGACGRGPRLDPALIRPKERNRPGNETYLPNPRTCRSRWEYLAEVPCDRFQMLCGSFTHQRSTVRYRLNHHGASTAKVVASE